jgi:hypothetical protein
MDISTANLALPLAAVMLPDATVDDQGAVAMLEDILIRIHPHGPCFQKRGVFARVRKPCQLSPWLVLRQDNVATAADLSTL